MGIEEQAKEDVNELAEVFAKECIDFGYWLVNSPNKELHKRNWIKIKYEQYRKDISNENQRPETEKYAVR